MATNVVTDKVPSRLQTIKYSTNDPKNKLTIKFFVHNSCQLLIKNERNFNDMINEIGGACESWK
jgi:hypothetical protein